MIYKKTSKRMEQRIANSDQKFYASLAKPNETPQNINERH